MRFFFFFLLYNLKLMLHVSFNKLFKLRPVVIILLFLLGKARRRPLPQLALSDHFLHDGKIALEMLVFYKRN